ncbi:MAG: F0F1 ATP synthase subunit A [Deltaproteobacteria bacterium]|jgi:F-type H+-transporting ATPase subunit a|nr:F0F1 ATP synthase subunit A [Deltaproteobacteria bacterium]
MEHPIFFITKLFEAIGLGHFAHAYPHVTYTWLIMLLLILFSLLAVKSIKMVPAGGQNLFEMVISGIEDFQVGVMGEHGRSLFPLIATLGIFIFISNALGLIPGFYSPTASLNTTLACALIVFFTTHIIGIKTHGFKYIKQFLGPVWWLAPLMLPIEIISHLSRVLSLTLRLFGNIMGEDLVLIILLFLAGNFLAPLPMMFLALFTSFVQAFVFALLSMIYLSAAMEEAH